MAESQSGDQEQSEGEEGEAGEFNDKLTDEEVDKIYHYFYTYVFPQERIKLMEEILKESITYSDFLEFYDKVVLIYVEK